MNIESPKDEPKEILVDLALTKADHLVFTSLEGCFFLILPVFLVSCGGTTTRQLLVAHGQRGFVLVCDSNVFILLMCAQLLSVLFETGVDVL